MENLKKGDKLTLFQINGMAMTSKIEVVFEYHISAYIVFKYPGKRKLMQIKLNNIGLAFKGHGLPIKADSDGNCFRGNACYNLVSTMPKQEVVDYIETNNLVKPSENDKAHMMLLTPEQARDVDYRFTIDNCLYPEASHESSMVDSIRNGKY